MKIHARAHMHADTHKGITSTHNPLNSLEPLLSVSHVIIWNSALSAPVSVAVAVCNKTCMQNLLVCASQHSAGWIAGVLAFWRWFLVCASWPLAFSCCCSSAIAEHLCQKLWLISSRTEYWLYEAQTKSNSFSELQNVRWNTFACNHRYMYSCFTDKLLLFVCCYYIIITSILNEGLKCNAGLRINYNNKRCADKILKPVYEIGHICISCIRSCLQPCLCPDRMPLSAYLLLLHQHRQTDRHCPSSSSS